jgi:hypothetical protein
MTIIELIVYGWLLHFVADWFLQNDWMAVNKSKRRERRIKCSRTGPGYIKCLAPSCPEKGEAPHYHWTLNLRRTWVEYEDGAWWDRHPAAHVHAGIHAVIQLVIFPWWAALIIGAIHFLIDLRTPLAWWRSFFHQTQKGSAALHVAMWQDQVAHLVVIALVAQLCGS